MVEITLNARKPGDENRQLAYVTLTIDTEDFELLIADVPANLTADQDVLDWLNQRKDEYHLLVLKKQYRGEDTSEYQDPEKSKLQIKLDWIAGGCKNPDETVIEKQPWKYRHPKWITWHGQIDEILDIPSELKDLLKDITREIG